MSIYKRGGVWWLYLVPPHGGARYRRSTGERERSRAQRIHDELKAELWKRKRSRSLHAALEAWVADKKGSNVSMVKVLKEKLKDADLDALDPKEIAKKIPQKTAGTFNRYVNILRAAGVKGFERKPEAKGRVRWITAEEWKALRAKLPDHQRPMADFAIATGLRQANVFRLEWSQVDLDRRRLWVHADQAKGGEPIGIPLSDDAVRVLKAQQKAREKRQEGLQWVFVGRGGKRPPVEIKTAWKTACKAAKVSNFRWHDLRHTWATWHIMQGTPREALQRLGGWKDDRMVSRYAHMAESFVDQYAGNAKPYQPRHISRHTKKASV